MNLISCKGFKTSTEKSYVNINVLEFVLFEVNTVYLRILSCFDKLPSLYPQENKFPLKGIAVSSRHFAATELFQTKTLTQALDKRCGHVP